jgi:rod shape-determining protein MreB
MSQGIRALFATDWTIDLGSTQVTVASSRRREPYREPALAARPESAPGRSRVTKRAMTWTGDAAVTALREQPGLQALRPIVHGRVRQADVLDLLLEGMIRRARGAAGWSRWFPSMTGLLVPPGLSGEDRMRSRDLALRHGLGHVRLIEMTLASAHGCGLALNEPGGQMVVDIGGGKVCVTALSMGGVVSWHWAETGGLDLDAALALHVERRYQVRISLFESERVKLDVGSAYPLDQPRAMEVYGVQTRSGLYQKVTLDDSEVRDVLADACEPLVQALHQGFKAVPPELASDILREGVVLTGGGALLPGLTDFLAERTGLRFRVARDPVNATLRGAQTLLWLGWRSGDTDVTAGGARTPA